MANAYDILYSLALVISSPVWLIKPAARKKVLTALRERMGHVSTRNKATPAVMIHAVSLGEINATRALIEKLKEHRRDLNFIVSTTTQTGWERAETLYGQRPDISLIRYPLDFSNAIARILDRFRPSLVVLMELEVWPNFLKHAEKRGIPVMIVNARLTTSALRNYRLAAPITKLMLRRLRLICAQDQAYADRFISLGANPTKVAVTGNMKFDNAQIAATVPGDEALARDLNLNPNDAIWVCGSTGPGEEELILDLYRSLLKQFPALRLVIVPRHPQRFDEVAALIPSNGFVCHRRTSSSSPLKDAVILGDTMGELRKFYSLATVIFVGRTLVDLGPRQAGSDMIEPAALSKPVIVGPYTANFADAMSRFRKANAMIEVHSAAELQQSITQLLSTPDHAASLGTRAVQVVRESQGATAKNAERILQFFP